MSEHYKLSPELLGEYLMIMSKARRLLSSEEYAELEDVISSEITDRREQETTFIGAMKHVLCVCGHRRNLHVKSMEGAWVSFLRDR